MRAGGGATPAIRKMPDGQQLASAPAAPSSFPSGWPARWLFRPAGDPELPPAGQLAGCFAPPHWAMNPYPQHSRDKARHSHNPTAGHTPMSAVTHPCMQGGREVQKEERRRAAKECPSARLSVCALRSYGWWAGTIFASRLTRLWSPAGRLRSLTFGVR